jgi:pyruvate/2-oxoglutarate dehydrogenase complex dihydrolipoamide dehydrogenase (E3) component
MSFSEVDVVVIGLGPGGEEVAGKLAEAGLDVVGIDERLVGGECPYWGCVPSKMMVRGAMLLAEGRRIPGMAGDAAIAADYAPVAKRIREEATDTWDDTVAVERFTGKGGTFVRGHGRLTAPGEVTVGDAVYRARRGVVIATGSAPVVPPLEGLAGTPFWTNHELVEAPEVPESLAIIGGGAIGVEFAQAFARFGVRVTVLEGSARLLALEEPESGELLEEVFAREGIEVRTGVRVTGVRHDGHQFTVESGRMPVTAERLLVATGRRVELAALGVEAVGLDPTARSLEVDEHLRAGEGLWAIGDATGRGAFTHIAMYQAAIALRSILGEAGPGADYTALPRVTFTDPEIGAVGRTEKQAREAGIRVRTGTAQVLSSSRGWIHQAGNDGFVKLVEDADRGVLIGGTTAGPAGGEVLGALVVAVHGRVPTETLRGMIYAYPTFHRAIEDALRDLH